MQRNNRKYFLRLPGFENDYVFLILSYLKEKVNSFIYDMIKIKRKNNIKYDKIKT